MPVHSLLIRVPSNTSAPQNTTALSEYYMPTEKSTVTQISARYTNALDMHSL
jgi:hypothetical protein